MKPVRKGPFAEDFDMAASIRNRFVLPILALGFDAAGPEQSGKPIIAAVVGIAEFLANMRHG